MQFLSRGDVLVIELERIDLSLRKKSSQGFRQDFLLPVLKSRKSLHHLIIDNQRRAAISPPSDLFISSGPRLR